MPRPTKGQRTPGSGKPKGYVAPQTREKEALRQVWLRKIDDLWEPIVSAQVQLAQGVNHMMARDKKGQWKQVTDPDEMLKCLESGESFYRIHAQNPDGRTIKDILDRLMGMPTQHVEMKVGLDEEVAKRLRGAHARTEKKPQ